MTARVCPVHGEYAPTGICRWCEPAPAPAKYSRAACDDVSIFRGVEYEDRFAQDVSAITGRTMPPAWEPWWEWKLEVVILSDPPPRWHLPARTLIANTPRPDLLAQHAALRWERVARRWATKAKFDGHERTVDGTLAFDDRCSECRRLGHRGNRIAAQEPKP